MQASWTELALPNRSAYPDSQITQCFLRACLVLIVLQVLILLKNYVINLTFSSGDKSVL